MRLKLLFFPLTLIVCVFVFFNYILPEIKNIGPVNEEKNNIQKALQGVKEKEETVKTLNQQISSNKIDKSKIINYLPVSRKEEQIIAGVNRLASDSQVFISDIAIVEKKQETPNSVPVSDTGIVPENTQQKKLQLSEAKIDILGDYEKIQLFLDQFQKMPLFNSLKSVRIYVQEQGITENNNPEISQSSNILAKIVADFGYLGQRKISSIGDLEELENSLDSTVVQALSEYTSPKIISSLPSPNSVGEGKSNPFLP